MKPTCCHPTESESSQTGKKSFLSKTGVLLAAIIILITLGFYIPLLFPLREALLSYLRIIALPVFIGIFLGGVIDRFIPSAYVSSILARPRKRTILYSVGLGFLMSACSHGILALSMELHKKGASGPSVVSFLLASPWANLPLTFLLIGMFQLKGVVIVMSAIFVALITGLVFQRLLRLGWIESNPNTAAVDTRFSILEDLRTRFCSRSWNRESLKQDLAGIGRGMRELTAMILWWILLGLLLASFAQAYIPSHLFREWLGPTVLGLFITLVIATLFEVCSEGSSPFAFEIYRQTGALGNSFAFLMGGVVTDYTEIGLLWQNLGRRTALWLLAVTLPQVFLLGLLLNHIY